MEQMNRESMVLHWTSIHTSCSCLKVGSFAPDDGGGSFMPFWTDVACSAKRIKIFDYEVAGY